MLCPPTKPGYAHNLLKNLTFEPNTHFHENG